MLERLLADPGVKRVRAGTHRTIEPAATLARVRPHLDTLGITRIADVTGLDRIGLPVVMVIRPESRSISVSQGKGLDLDAAKASGVMEALESWHAERVTLPLTHAARDELPGAIETDALPHVDVPEPGRRGLWVDARELLADQACRVPYETVHTDYTLPGLGHSPLLASTNGLASGNHPLEALCHALAEVIERDSTTLWGRLPRAAREATRIDLSTIDEPLCARVLELLERAGLEVAVWDTTTDVGIAAFYALIADPTGGHSGAGAGCHPSRAVALLRALTEAVQVRTTYVSGARDDLRAREYGPGGRAEKARRAALLMRTPPRRAFREVPTQEADTFADDLLWLLDRLRGAGIREVAAVDLSRQAIGVPVMRVVVPGLEGPDDHPDSRPGPRALAVPR